MMVTKTQSGNLCELIGTAVENASNRKDIPRHYTDRLLHVLEMTVPVLEQFGRQNSQPSPEKQFLFPTRQSTNVTPIITSLQTDIDKCSWFCADTFYPEERYRGFSEKVWGSQILGHEDALYSVDERLIALMILIEPNTTYPLHAHRIEELYLVLAGGGEWSNDGETWEQLEPGMVFHNPPWGPHTMRTGNMPVIALGLYLPPFGWEGGLI